MALDAGIARCHVIHVRRIDDVVALRFRRVLAARTVTSLTTHVPLCDLLRMDVVTNRMAAVAQGTSGSMHVVTRIKPCPPIASRSGHDVLAPFMVLHLPLHWQRKIVVADFREIPLLPDAAIDESNLILRK